MFYFSGVRKEERDIDVYKVLHDVLITNKSRRILNFVAFQKLSPIIITALNNEKLVFIFRTTFEDQ